MALDPILWAMKDAPVADVEEWAVLCVMAESADEDGCNAYQSLNTIASRTKLSKQTARHRVQAMEARGLLKEGDQRYPMLLRIPAHLRPTNYDLQVPYSWFNNIERINDFRAGRGRDPLERSDRPDLGAAPEKKKRADTGKKKPKKDAEPEVADEQLPVTVEEPDTTGDPVPDAPAEDLFEVFWKVYPKKDAKAAALKAWKVATVNNKVSPEVIIEGARRLAASPNLPTRKDHPNMRFVPYPATWLNRGQWEDEQPLSHLSGRQGGPYIDSASNASAEWAGAFQKGA